MTSSGAAPVDAADVTVVVICFNDAERLPRAVASIQRQTLRALEIVIVDDASTDETEEVARAICAADPRVRYVRLEANSGGCSAPRNRGLDLARTPWIMFCDSDDEYERHACKNLLVAAERTGAEVVCGTAERIDVGSGRTRRWRPDLHAVERVVDSLEELPELLYDTISVNKIYRVDMLRDNAIRFPEGILFEDQLFTLEAQAAARRIAVIPETVYRWYVDRLGDDLSITQRRNELRNVDSRIEVNRRIDAFLVGREALRAAKDEKFLRHDLYLYLVSMVEVDDATATGLIDRLVPYVEQASLEAVWRLRPALRVAIFHLLSRDLEGVRSAMRFLTWASVVNGPIVGQAGREFWASAHLAESDGPGGRSARDWLDVTDLGLLRIPFSQRRLLHRIDSFVVHGDVAEVRGRTWDYDGSLVASDRVDLRFLLPGGRIAMRVPLEWEAAADRRTGWRTWRGSASPSSDRTLVLGPEDRGQVAVAVGRDHLECVTAIRSERSDCPTVDVRYPGPVARTGPDTITCGAGDNGAVTWRATTSPTRRRGRRRAAPGADPAAGRMTRWWNEVGRDVLRPLLSRLARRLPATDVVVLDAPTARAFTGDLRAVATAIGRVRPDVQLVWANRSAPDLAPAGATVVERGGPRHSWLLGRARWTVDDWSEGPGSAGVAAATTIAAGAPVRRVGLDDPALLLRRAAVADLRRAARSRRQLLTATTDAGLVYAHAFGDRRPAIPVGRPRLDELGAARSTRDRSAARRELDVPTDRAIVLFAPAVRGTRAGGEHLLDLDRFAEMFGPRAYLIVAAAAGEPISVPTRLRWAIRELTAGEDGYDFLPVADLVIADYGPIVADAAALDLPVVLSWPDRAAFVDRAHGVYPEVVGAGPIAEDANDLADIVGDWLEDPAAFDVRFGPARRAWAARWCGVVDGSSADRAAAQILGMAR